MEENKDQIFEFKYSRDILDKMIKKINNGIEVMIPVDMEEEIELRKKEVQILIKKEYDDEGITDILSDEETQKLIDNHKKILDSQLEKEKRKTHFDEFITFEITEEQRKKMEELCATSYVRKIPDHFYHKTEEELDDDAERRLIMNKVKRVTNMYYTAEDWRNAMLILIEAYKYSKEHDYPGIPDYLKEGRIRLNHQMPALCLNYKHIIKDLTLLKGILNGEVECIDKSKADVPKVTRKKDSEVTGIPLRNIGRIMSSEEEAFEIQRARMGDNRSIILAASKMQKSVFDRFSPDSILGESVIKLRPNQFDENGNMRVFNFFEEGSAQRAFNIVNNKKTSLSQFSQDIINANDGQISGEILSGSKLQEISKTFNYSTGSEYNNYSTNVVNPQLNPKSEVVQMEQNLLNMMRQYNPNI